MVHQIENDKSFVAEPYQLDRAGKPMQAAKICTVAGAGLTVAAGRTRIGQIASWTLLAAGSLLPRFGVFDAGMASARNPEYTVIPQRERMAAQQNGHAPPAQAEDGSPSLVEPDRVGFARVSGRYADWLTGGVQARRRGLLARVFTWIWRGGCR
jgi:hypothetical protein